MHNIFVILLLLIVLTSCSPSTTVSSTALPQTETKTQQLTPTKTLTPQPLASATFSASLTPSPTPDSASYILYSPDGRYVAKRYDPDRRPSLEKPVIEIFEGQSKLLWQIPYQGEVPNSDPHPSLNIYRWSKDSSALYFYYSEYPDGGDYAFWWNGFNLQKITISTGHIKSLLPGKGFMAFAFSPDETQIAYSSAQDLPKGIIYIQNLATGANKKVFVKPALKNYVRVGNLKWSPSGKKLEFQTEDDEYGVQTFYLDIVTMEQKLINEYRVDDMWLEGWNEDNKLRFISIKSEIILIDITTDGITIIGTATPKP